MRPVHSFYAFTLLVALSIGMIAPVYPLFLDSIGLSLAEIGILQTIFWLSVTALETPTGMIADGRGYSWSLAAGCVFLVLGAAAYAGAIGFWSAVVGEGLIAVGAAFHSGAANAWAKTAIGPELSSSHVFGTAQIMRRGGFLVGGIISSGICLMSLRLTWVVMALFALLALGVVMAFMHPHDGKRRRQRVHVREGIAAIHTNPSLRWLIGLSVAMGGVMVYNYSWALYVRETMGTEWNAVTWTVICLALMAGGYWVRRSGKLATADRDLCLSLGVTGIGMILMAFGGSALFFSGLVIHELARGIHSPVWDSFVQEHAPDDLRATVESMLNQVTAIGLAITPSIAIFFVGGEPTTSELIGSTWVWAGVVMVALAFVAWMLRPRDEP